MKPNRIAIISLMILLVATGTVYAQNEKAVGMNYAKASADTVPYRQFMAYPVSMKVFNPATVIPVAGPKNDTTVFLPRATEHSAQILLREM